MLVNLVLLIWVCLLCQTPSTRHRVQRAKVTARETWRDGVLRKRVLKNNAMLASWLSPATGNRFHGNHKKRKPNNNKVRKMRANKRPDSRPWPIFSDQGTFR
jgi:hypothetical protein